MANVHILVVINFGNVLDKSVHGYIISSCSQFLTVTVVWLHIILQGTVKHFAKKLPTLDWYLL